MDDRFVPFNTQLPKNVSDTIDFIVEDDCTTDEDLVNYFRQVMAQTLPEDIRHCEICAKAITYFNTSTLNWSSSWYSLKECFARSYKEVILYANVEGLRIQFLRDKSKYENKLEDVISMGPTLFK